MPGSVDAIRCRTCDIEMIRPPGISDLEWEDAVRCFREDDHGDACNFQKSRHARDTLYPKVYCPACCCDQHYIRKVDGKRHTYHCRHCNHNFTIDQETCMVLWRVDMPEHDLVFHVAKRDRAEARAKELLRGITGWPLHKIKMHRTENQTTFSTKVGPDGRMFASEVVVERIPVE